MKAKNKRRLFAITANLIIILALLAGIAYAAAVNIDTFNVGEQNLDAIPATPNVSEGLCSLGTYVVGDCRNAEIHLTDGQQHLRLLIDYAGATNYLSYNADSGVKGTGKITWDGDNDPGAFDPVGLGGIDLISSNPANDGMLMSLLDCDNWTTLKLMGYTDGSNYADLSYTLRGNSSMSRLDLFYPFSAFNVTGSSFSWSDIGALTLDIDGTIADDLDLTIDYLQADNAREYGDLPDGTDGTPNYSAVLPAYHIPRGLTLGNDLDVEADYQASVDTLGDDDGDWDDEDGVQPYRMAEWFVDPEDYYGYLQVTVQGCTNLSTGCKVNGWIDWNGDGTFSSGERIIRDANMFNGTTEVGFDIPTTLSDGYVYARFRVCTGDTGSVCTDPGTTGVINGEVEDYRWYLGPTAADLSSFSAAWGGAGVLVEWQTASEVGMKGFNVWRATDPGDHGTRLNPTTIAPLNPGELIGSAYSYTDDTALPGTAYDYWLEIEYTGASSVWYGPERLAGPFKSYLPLVWVTR